MVKFPCPCCCSLVYLSPAKGDYSICPVCQWEDDPVQSIEASYAGGANKLSLEDHRERYLKNELLKNLKMIK